MDVFFGLKSKPRFSRADIAKFTKRDCENLRAAHVGITTITANVQALLDTNRVTMPLNLAESTIVAEHLKSMESGTNAMGGGFETKCQAAKTLVVYDDPVITITPVSGDPIVLPNNPVAPIIPDVRDGLKYLVPFLFSCWDIDKGVLVPIRSWSTIQSRWPAGTSIHYQFLSQIQLVLEAILRRYSVSILMFKKEETVKGYYFSDLLYNALSSCPLVDYWSLHLIIVANFWADIIAIQKEGQLTRYGSRAKQGKKEPKIPFTTWSVEAENRDNAVEYRKFVEVTNCRPQIIRGGIDPIHIWTKKELATFETNANDSKKTLALIGGTKRGSGKIAVSLNYAPRQGKIFRDLNMMIMLTHTVLKHFPDASVDIHATSGHVALLFDYFSRGRKPEDKSERLVRVVVPVETKGISPNDFVSFKTRPGAIQVLIDRTTDVPDVQADTAKKTGKANDKLKTGFDEWKARATIHTHFITSTKAFWRSHFEEYTTFPLPHAHLLEAVVTNVTGIKFLVAGVQDPKPWQYPISAEAWVKKVHNDLLKMNGWWLAPFSTVSPLGRFFTFNGSSLTFQEGEWQITHETVQVLPDPAQEEIVLRDDDDGTPAVPRAVKVPDPAGASLTKALIDHVTNNFSPPTGGITKTITPAPPPERNSSNNPDDISSDPEQAMEHPDDV